VVGAGEQCSETVCPVHAEGVPVVVPPGETRELVIACGVHLHVRGEFFAAIPLYYESAPGCLETIDLSVSGRDPAAQEDPRGPKAVLP
jgi:hypothetical protein